jgi:hypothetical protein
MSRLDHSRRRAGLPAWRLTASEVHAETGVRVTRRIRRERLSWPAGIVGVPGCRFTGNAISGSSPPGRGTRCVRTALPAAGPQAANGAPQPVRSRDQGEDSQRVAGPFRCTAGL